VERLPDRRAVDPAGRLAGQGDAGRLAEPVPLRHRLDRLGAVAALPRPEVVAEVVEEHVVGGRQRARHVERPQRLVRVVVEGALPGAAWDGEAAGVVDERARADQPVVERGRGGDQLEGRSRRVQPRDRAVEQRLVRGRAGQAPVGRLADAADPHRRVVARVGRHRQHRAVARVQHHRGAALRRKRPAGAAVDGVLQAVDLPGEAGVELALQAEVDGEPQVLAGHWLGDAEHPHDLALGVDLQPLQPVAAAQHLVVGLLDAGLADVVAGQRTPVGGVPQLVGGDWPDVAEQLCRRPAGWVAADGERLGRHSGVPVGVLGELEQHPGPDVLGHRDGERRAGEDAQPLADPRARHPEQRHQAVQRGAGLGAELAGVDHHRPGGLVAHQHPAGPVQDLPAGSR
jgi:hypothetical protein